MSIQDQIAALQKQAREEDAACRKKQSEAWQLIIDNPDNWEWRSIATTNYDMRGKEVVDICKRIKPDMLKEWKKGGFSTFASTFQEEGWFGANYGRTTEGILNNVGGGHLVIPVPKMCSDAQWEQLKMGIIPNELKAQIVYQ
jgi:hypothetical protein